jgi:hypothetical protein
MRPALTAIDVWVALGDPPDLTAPRAAKVGFSPHWWQNGSSQAVNEAPCRIREYNVGRNSISFVHDDTGLEIILVSGKKRQAVVRTAIHAAGTCDFAALRQIAFAARPPLQRRAT